MKRIVLYFTGNKVNEEDFPIYNKIENDEILSLINDIKNEEVLPQGLDDKLELLQKYVFELNNKYTSLKNNISFGYAYMRILKNDDGPFSDEIFLDVNEKFAQFFGKSRKSLIGKTFSEVFDVSDKQIVRWKEAFYCVENEEQSDTFEYFYQARNKWFEVSICLPQNGFISILLKDISEERKYKIKYEQPETIYQTIFESIGTGIAIIENDGMIILCNSIFVLLSGYDKEELLNGFNAFDLVSDKNRSCLQEYHKRGISGEKGLPLIYDFDLITKTGSVKHVTMNVKVISSTGKCILSVIDLTEQKNIEQERLRNERYFRNLFEMSSDGIVLLDHDGRIIDANKEFVRLLDCESDELTGLSFFSVLSRKTRENETEFIEMIRKNGYLEPLEVKVIGIKDYSSTYAEVKMSAIRDKNGSVTNIIANVRDITERFVSHEELKISEKQYRQILNSLSDSVVVVDRMKKVVLLNDRARIALDRYGLEGDVKGLIIDEAFPYIPLQSFDIIDDVFSEGKIVTTELTFNPKHFQIEIEVRLLPVEENGKVEQVVMIIRNVTEKKKAELELYRYMTELKKSNEELDDFAYIASHDLKEPLRGINNFSQFLYEDYVDKLDDEGKHRLTTIVKLSKRMDGLINVLLKYSRIGRTSLEIRPVNLNNLISECKEWLVALLTDENVEVRVPRRLPVINCDMILLREVFINLISNAIKYNDSRVKWVEIGCIYDNPYLLYVKDNGIGINSNQYKDIFKIFVQYNNRKRYGNSTGAGLTIVKKIIERHDGKIWVDSEKGSGTTFYFTLGV